LLDTDMKIISLGRQNYFVGILKIMNNAAKKVDILATGSSVLHNYFDTYYYFDYLLFSFQQNYFSDLYPAKILDLSAKPFFPCR